MTSKRARALGSEPTAASGDTNDAEPVSFAADPDYQYQQDQGEGGDDGGGGEDGEAFGGGEDGEAFGDGEDGEGSGEGGEGGGEGGEVGEGASDPVAPILDYSAGTLNAPASSEAVHLPEQQRAPHWKETAVNVLTLSIVVCGWLIGLIWLPRLIDREGSLSDSLAGKIAVYVCWTLLCILGLFAPLVWLVLVVPASIIVLSIGANRSTSGSGSTTATLK